MSPERAAYTMFILHISYIIIRHIIGTYIYISSIKYSDKKHMHI